MQSVQAALSAFLLYCPQNIILLLHYSVLKLFAGFAAAVRIACKVMVNNAIPSVTNPATANIHH